MSKRQTKSMEAMGIDLINRAHEERMKNGGDYPKSILVGFPPVGGRFRMSPGAES
ncbi:hypothetical protein [Ralstonia phage GP4]|uniref:Uncharacterized protein n=4 Tax=Caudoviricetes TaxID=2731619 RepID=A0A345GTX0_9CAUD|nr:hypothetical protein KMC46_gp60 [Ralstonia phage Gamede]YP_010078642.1 hypothetical protein KMC50_gp52 [Ralstonia phage Claudette]YP_010078771.1 hypothetical protein KMC52_gp39 [Ralstonia phage GP4]QMV32480.1 hypothetical protein 20A_00031 [Ralstonia phage Alix]AXG67734.1 hypothetical protein [Ralstonia phage GP4]QOQ37825.1 hypothetical protein 9Ga_00064 [Ralstonia phage Gamede]QPD96370.1 hypothetical protein 20Ca_00052 [Ralstonia phage Claudette]